MERISCNSNLELRTSNYSNSDVINATLFLRWKLCNHKDLFSPPYLHSCTAQSHRSICALVKASLFSLSQCRCTQIPTAFETSYNILCVFICQYWVVMSLLEGIVSKILSSSSSSSLFFKTTAIHTNSHSAH